MTARMSSILLVLLLPILVTGCLIPTDHDIAAKITRTINEKYHPEQVSVVVHRNSIFSTKVKRLEITMSGFTAEQLPVSIDQLGATGQTVPVGEQQAKGKEMGMLIRVVDTRITCTDFTLKQLPVASMTLNLQELRVPLNSAKNGQLVIASAESITGDVLLSQQGLNEYARTQALPLSDPTVSLSHDGCTIRGTTKTLLQVPVEVSGRLISRDPALLYLENPELRVLSLTMPQAITEKILADLNPLIDVNKAFVLPIPVQITGIEHQDKQLRVVYMFHFPQREGK